jgi:putative oxygen-independent coproporphyrinogen III oxidase
LTTSIFWTIPESAYIHIPFCRRRCFYCDFPISVIGDKSDPAHFPPIDRYVESLEKEISHSANLGKPLKTIFFGGGTPSLLPIEGLSKIIQALEKKFGISPDSEISIEIDPGTFTADKLIQYQNLGINRISLGVQAFQDELLKTCGRSHNLEQIWDSLEFLLQVNFQNFSLDLISGLPNQTIEQWEESLEKVISASPTHVSCYDLVLESVTAFGKMYVAGCSPLPSEETAADMYRMAQRKLTQAGYEHYEISNYARKGYQCQHNIVYWENRSYYGFGMGAASYLQGVRYTRAATQNDYYQYVNSLENEQFKFPKSPNNKKDLLLETLMLGLRLAEGISLEKLESDFGYAITENLICLLQSYSENGWVKISPKRIHLSDPDGFLFSNVVLTRIFEMFD